jgi:hypothetical protein
LRAAADSSVRSVIFIAISIYKRACSPESFRGSGLRGLQKNNGADYDIRAAVCELTVFLLCGGAAYVLLWPDAHLLTWSEQESCGIAKVIGTGYDDLASIVNCVGTGQGDA